MSNDQDRPSDNRSLVPLRDDQSKPSDNKSLFSWSNLSNLSSRLVAKLSEGTISQSAIADAGSIAIAGDNNGSIHNTFIYAPNSNLARQQQIARELPSYLSRVVAKFAEDLSGYGEAPRCLLPPEVSEKLIYNDFPSGHPIIADYTKYLSVLEAVYQGIEQRNDDARRLIRRRASVAYKNALQDICTASGVHHTDSHAFARANSVALVRAVVATLTAGIQVEAFPSGVMQETADLAISLIVADAVIECEVLERPPNAAAT